MIVILISFVIVNFIICKKLECLSKEIYNKIWLQTDLVPCAVFFPQLVWGAAAALGASVTGGGAPGSWQ